MQLPIDLYRQLQLKVVFLKGIKDCLLRQQRSGFRCLVASESFFYHFMILFI